jgi:hypothetical protein
MQSAVKNQKRCGGTDISAIKVEAEKVIFAYYR